MHGSKAVNSQLHWHCRIIPPRPKMHAPAPGAQLLAHTPVACGFLPSRASLTCFTSNTSSAPLPCLSASTPGSCVAAVCSSHASVAARRACFLLVSLNTARDTGVMLRPAHLHKGEHGHVAAAAGTLLHLGNTGAHGKCYTQTLGAACQKQAAPAATADAAALTPCQEAHWRAAMAAASGWARTQGRPAAPGAQAQPAAWGAAW